MATCSDSMVFDPACEMNVSANTMTGKLVEGAAWGDHTIEYSQKVTAFVGPYCPVVAGSMSMKRNGEFIGSTAVISDNMALF